MDVPAVPDFDRCSDRCRPSRSEAESWSQQFPTSIGAQTSRSAATPVSRRRMSQQFPTSIGAQTRMIDFRRAESPCPSSSRLRSVLRLARKARQALAVRVPAVPDFDRCSDTGRRTGCGCTGGPSSSRLRSVLRPTARCTAGPSSPCPSSSRLRSVLRPAPVPAGSGRLNVPAVPDFDRCSDRTTRLGSVPNRTVPAVPDFDRCSDAFVVFKCDSDRRSQQFPTSIGAQTRGRTRRRATGSGPSSSRLRSVLRRPSTLVAPGPATSQQFPTSIGAQTRPLDPTGRLPSGPSSSRLRSVLRHSKQRFWRKLFSRSQQFPTSIGAQTRLKGGRRSRTMVPAVPDFDRCSDRRWRAYRSSRPRVPAVPDFDRCSDKRNPSSSARMYSCPSSSRLRSVLRHPPGGQGRGVGVDVPAVPDFDRCSDNPVG